MSPIERPLEQIKIYAVTQSVSRAFETALIEQSSTLLPVGFGLYFIHIGFSPYGISVIFGTCVDDEMHGQVSCNFWA